MAGVAAGAAIVGAGISVYGQLKGAQAQADAQREEAGVKAAQANEIESRNEANVAQLQRAEGIKEAEFGAAFAATGREGGGVGGQLEIKRQSDVMVANANRDAAFKARMLRAGATIDTTLASDMATASYLGATGTVLGMAGKFASINRPVGKSESLFTP